MIQPTEQTQRTSPSKKSERVVTATTAQSTSVVSVSQDVVAETPSSSSEVVDDIANGYRCAKNFHWSFDLAMFLLSLEGICVIVRIIIIRGLNCGSFCFLILGRVRTCLRYFLPPQWVMDKDVVSGLTPQQLATFPLDDFFDHYERGLKKVD